MRTIITTGELALTRRSAHKLALGVAAALTASACGSSATGDSDSTAEGTDSVILLDNNPLGTYNPVNNHGRNGESRIYEGLFRVQPGEPDSQPEITPLLAAGDAVPSNENRTWTVETRTDVTFSDGSPFEPEDVVATYTALINPKVASTELVRWQNLAGVEVGEGSTVIFHLHDSFPEFDRLLLTGIAPRARLDEEGATTDSPVTAAESTLNTDPIGTGPYVLADLRPDQAVFETRDDYWGDKPEVTRFVVRQVEDESARAQQLRSGEGDGSILSGELAMAFDGDADFTVSSRPSADWHALTLPTAHPFVGDPAVRLALNLALDRNALVDGALGGHGTPNSTFLAPFYGDAYDPELEIPFDLSRAEQLLEDAGWTREGDAIRARDGEPAAFDLIYFTNVGETRKLVALDVASQFTKLGIDVRPVALNSGDVSDEDYRTTPLVLGGGSQPYTVDGQLYTTLHSQYAEAGVGAKWDNASDYVNPDVDRALDAARVETDRSARDAHYRDMQAAYSADPGMLQVAYLNHVYVSRDQGWTEPGVALEPHSHGVEYGPWYTLAEWTR